MKREPVVIVLDVVTCLNCCTLYDLFLRAASFVLLSEIKRTHSFGKLPLAASVSS